MEGNKYSSESIERDIVSASNYDRDPKYSQAYSNVAIAKILYNLMAEGNNDKDNKGG